MTAAFRSFEVSGRPRLEIKLTSGEVRMVAGDDPSRVEVRIDGGDPDRLLSDQRGDTVVIASERGRWLSRDSFDLTIAVPRGAAVDVRVVSADVNIEVPLSELAAGITSGDLRLGDVEGDVTVKTASGDVRIGSVAGRLEVSSASGDVRVVDAAGDAELSTASGDLNLGRAGGRVQARSASGDVTVGEFGGIDLTCRALSGTVRIGIPAGRSLDVEVQSLSGEVRSEFEVGRAGGGGVDGVLRVKTVSGDVLLTTA